MVVRIHGGGKRRFLDNCVGIGSPNAKGTDRRYAGLAACSHPGLGGSNHKKRCVFDIQSGVCFTVVCGRRQGFVFQTEDNLYQAGQAGRLVDMTDI